ncbi:MAG: YncE family protein [Terriglobales bacterium]
MRKAGIFFVLIAAAGWVSCGGGGSSTPQRRQSFLAKRAFLTNSSTSNSAGVVSILDAAKDLFGLNAMTVAPGTNVIATTIPGKVTITASKTTAQTAIIDNTTESVRGFVSLPSFTDSMVVTPDGRFAFAAVHNTNSIEIINMATAALCTVNTTTCKGPITVDAPTKIVLSGDGKTLLAFSDSAASADTVFVINVAAATSSTAVGPAVPTLVPGFDHAVNAVFASDNTTAYVMNCGDECGGTAAGVQVLNTATQALGATSGAVPATVGLLDGGNLFVAGTSSPGTTDGGQVTKLNPTTLAVVKFAPIPPGVHDTMAAQTGKVFVGSRNCIDPGNQGCLAIWDGSGSTATIPGSVTDGDVTGMQAISNRSVVYVIVGGELRIYDANTSALQSQQLDIIGHAEQVVQVDP